MGGMRGLLGLSILLAVGCGPRMERGKAGRAGSVDCQTGDENLNIAIDPFVQNGTVLQSTASIFGAALLDFFVRLEDDGMGTSRPTARPLTRSMGCPWRARRRATPSTCGCRTKR